MTIDYSVAQSNLRKLIQEVSPLGDLLNEAQTRFDFIDRFLVECLGWNRDKIRVEVFEDGERTDYECGSPRALIVEAKRGDAAFSFPPRPRGSKSRIKIKSLVGFNESVGSAVRQVIDYCHDRGVPVAVVSNGSQLIAFVASRLDGVAPLEGDAFVFDSYEDILNGFSTIYECLSPAGVEEKRIQSMLGGRLVGALPPKMSSICKGYYDYKYSSEFQENIRNAISLIVEDLGRGEEFEKEFLKECYCESGPLTQYSYLSKNLLQNRYAALFPQGEAGSSVVEMNPKGGSARLSERVVADAMARRPVVILGDVGVGKTSFLKNLIHIDAEAEFESAIFVYYDLGSKGTLSVDAKEGLLTKIEETLRGSGVNLIGKALLEQVYKSELFDFDQGIWGALASARPDEFEIKRIEYLNQFAQNRSEHLRRSVAYVAESRRCQVIIAIDNADQRSFEVQQEAFLLANELAATWNAMVFVAMRPQTFHSSRRSGAISAYPPKVFAISPPRLEEAIKKRLVFALNVIEGKDGKAATRGFSLHIESLGILIRNILDSLDNNKELYEYIVNVSGGNIRLAIELITKFVGNPNVDAEKIIKILSDGGRYYLPLHEFAKGGLLGDLAFYQEEASVAYPIYSVVFSDRKEHFLALLVLGFLDFEGNRGGSDDGFVGIGDLEAEIQNQGFTLDQISSHLRRLVRKKLIETSERRLLEGGEGGTKGAMPEAFRITSLGAYHLKKWAYDFSFIDAVLFETPIFDKEVRDSIFDYANSHQLSDRYSRVSRFVDYLDSVWPLIKERPYFNWPQMKAVGSESFERVERRLRDLGFI